MKKRKNQEIDTLKKLGQKSRDTLVASLIHRKISIRITRYLLSTNIKPNHITIISFLFMLSAAVLFAQGVYVYNIIGAILIQLGFLFDCIDGEIARIKKLKSNIGKLLDDTLGTTGLILIYFCLGYGIFRTTHNIWIWLLVLLIVSGILIKNLLTIIIQNLDLGKTGWQKVEEKAGRQYILGWGGGSDELFLSIGAILNQLPIILVIIVIAVNAHWIGQLSLNLRKVFKKTNIKKQVERNKT